MHVPHERPRLAQGRGRVSFLDVHVKQVGEDPDVSGAQGPKPTRRITEAIEQIRLITVERLVEQWHAVHRRGFAQVFKCFREPGQRLIPRDGSFPTALHGTDDRRGSELARQFDDLPDELAGTLPDLRVRVRQHQFVHDPAGSGADRRHAEAVLAQQFSQQGPIQRGG